VGRPLVSYIEHGYIPSAALRDRIAQALDTAEAELWPGLSDQVAA
jgi:hypothetical protein